jgi:anaerobic dimethyl sulfoxide reductase subunit A
MGHAMRQQIFGPDRLKYPIKRKNWAPLTGGDRSLRGRDEWVRISWDEALDAIAAELKHAKETWGNRSIFYMNMINLEGYLGSVLSVFGGYVDCSGTQSTGTFGLHNEMFGLVGDVASSQSNDRMDLINSDYVVLYAHNAAWCAFGNPSFYLKGAKEKGVKFVYVAPDYSVTAGFTNAEWIPVRPGEDTALLLGTAYAMLMKDKNGSYIDWDYLNRCTVGFDAEHMPEDAKTTENFKDYLLGKYDDTPKTPEWASALCGTPVELIERFADILSCQNNVAIHACAAPARNKGSENFPHMLTTIAAMGGHFGKPGNGCSNDQYYGAFNSGAPLAMQPMGGPPARFTNAGNPIDDVLSTDCMWDNILDGHYWFAGSNFPGCEQKKLEYRDIDVHVIISETNNFLQSQSNINKGIAAFRKVDFVCAQSYTLKLDAKYADIVLPISTKWETTASCLYSGAAISSDKENVFAWRQVIEPLYDTKNDPEIAAALAERLGVDAGPLFPKSEKQLWFEQMAGAVVLQPDGSYKPVATVTQQDIERYGVAAEPQEGFIPFEEFLDRGVYRMPRAADDAFVSIPYQKFREDPKANPLGTASGKMEIYCQAKSDWYDMVNGYSDGGAGALDYVRVSPLPKYLEHPFGYAGTFADADRKVKGAYPIQMTHNHYLRRAHTDCDNLPWLREAFQNPVFISKQDAEERGIKQGDVIKVYNEQGAFLRPATISRGIMPGVIIVPHGATARIDEESCLDLAGADNILTPSNRTTTPFLNSWNSVLVNYEKYTGPLELVPDALMEPIVPAMAE